MDLKQITDLLKKFRDKRDWKQFHTPLNLSVSLQLEISELLEKFQWKTNEKFVKEYSSNEELREEVKDELADILSYLLLTADSLDVDLEKAIQRKIKKNDAKYPVEKAKGNPSKYTKL